MTKKAYMKPVMNVVKIQQRVSILSGSLDPNGMNKSLQTKQTVNSAWSRGNRGWDDDDE